VKHEGCISVLLWGGGDLKFNEEGPRTGLPITDGERSELKRNQHFQGEWEKEGYARSQKTKLGVTRNVLQGQKELSLLGRETRRTRNLF